MTNTHLDNLIQSYNNHAQQRETGPVLDWKFPERDRVLALFQQEKTQTLLEIGAGTGRDSLFFQEHDLRVTAIDLSPTNITLCREKGLNAHLMDMSALDFPINAFDAVYAMNSLLHLPKAEMPACYSKFITYSNQTDSSTSAFTADTTRKASGKKTNTPPNASSPSGRTRI